MILAEIDYNSIKGLDGYLKSRTLQLEFKIES